MKRRLAAAVAGLGLFFSLPANAEITKDQCIEANTSGQSLRRRAKLAESREQFRRCMDPACPEIIRADCTQRFDEVQNAQPTIVFDVKSGAGEDLRNVTIKVDGTPVTATEGAAMTVEPGAHEFTFEVPNEKPVVRTFILKEGEKARREKVTIGEAPPPPVAPPVQPQQPPPVTPQEPERDGSGQRLGAVIGSIVGLAAVGVGAIFGVKAIGDSSDQKDKCKATDNCADRSAALKSHDSASSAATLSTVFMISGGVIVAGAAVVYFLAPRKSTTATAVLRQAIGGIEF